MDTRSTPPRLFAVLLATIAIGSLSATAALAVTWHVLPDGSGDAPTIQAALDGCAAGDTVMVAAGTYYENLIWPATQNIVLTSESGPEATIIDGSGTGRVIRMTGPLSENTVVSYLTIRNGYLTGSDEAGSGAGIGCAQEASPTIRGNLITANILLGPHAGGAGIGCWVSSPTIIENTITDNAVGGTEVAGVGIACFESEALIRDNTISYNTITHGSLCGGAGIYIVDCSPTVLANIIVNNTIAGTATSSAGGGIFVNSPITTSEPHIEGNTLVDNDGSIAGGGIYFHDNGGGVVSGNTISDNVAWRGGGIAVVRSFPTISDNVITNNFASEEGGGIKCRDIHPSGSPTILRNDIIGNTSPFGTGGGIHLGGASPTIHRCVIKHNGTGIHCESQDGHDSDPLVRWNLINHNVDAGLVNAVPGVVIDAVWNWWGDPSGPYHPTSNPSGLGDAVSDHVAFDPWVDDITDADGTPPATMSLHNFPNPFNPHTTIAFATPADGPVLLQIMDLRGHLVATLVNEVKPVGRHEVTWSGRDGDGQEVPSGVYLSRLEVASQVAYGRMTLVR